jgi:hypothetical protein
MKQRSNGTRRQNGRITLEHIINAVGRHGQDLLDLRQETATSTSINRGAFPA